MRCRLNVGLLALLDIVIYSQRRSSLIHKSFILVPKYNFCEWEREGEKKKNY